MRRNKKRQARIEAVNQRRREGRTREERRTSLV
jgi:hypothetical protein